MGKFTWREFIAALAGGGIAAALAYLCRALGVC